MRVRGECGDGFGVVVGLESWVEEGVVVEEDEGLGMGVVGFGVGYVVEVGWVGE